MQSDMPVPRSRKGLYIPVILFGLVCAAWTGFWFYARSQTVSIMDAWMAREARLGRVWTCPDRDVGGFPFRIDVSCVKPTFTSSEPARAGTGSLAGLGVTARAVDPRQVIAAFASPLTWQSAAGDSVELGFTTGRAAYRGTPAAMDLVSFELVDPRLTVTDAGGGKQVVAATATEFHLRRAPGDDPATDVAIMASGIKSELFDALSGDASPGVIDIRTQFTKYAPAPIRDWRETLEAWRRADGEVKIEKLALTKGPLALNATGVLRLDELRRPEGDITGSAAGINTVLRAFGIDMGGGAGGLLGAILGGGNRPNAAPKALPFALRFDQGRMYIGPVPGPRLRPLYGP